MSGRTMTLTETSPWTPSTTPPPIGELVETRTGDMVRRLRWVGYAWFYETGARAAIAPAEWRAITKGGE